MVEIGGPPGTPSTSYSAFRTWVSCQERWRLIKIIKRTRLTGWALVGGSAVHDLTSKWEEAYFHATQGMAA